MANTTTFICPNHLLMKRLTALLFMLLLMRQLPAQVNPCDRTRPNIPYSTLPGDTTVVYPQGTRLTFNRCEFFDIRNCLTVTEAFDLPAIQQAGFTTMTDNGILLATAGMLKIELSTACNGRNYFEVPVRVEMPVWFSHGGCADTSGNGFRLYTSSGGLWNDTLRTPVETITRNGKKFIVLLIRNALNINWDKPVPANKIKFKTKALGSISRLTVSGGCPLTQIHFYPGRNSRKVIAKIPCFNRPETVFISAKGYSKSGDTVNLAPIPFTQVKHGNRMKNCRPRTRGPVIKRILGIFPIRKGAVYRKYFIA
jgi:hypothetical protein